MKQLKLNVLVLAVFFACFGFTSCNKVYYQVYHVNSKSLNLKNNNLEFENDDVKVMYNLWEKQGNPGFIVMNKTDKDIFIDLKQTFFILNDLANDYYLNREYTNTTTTESSVGIGASQKFNIGVGFWPDRYYVPTTVSSISKLLKGSSHGVTSKEKDVICVPAASYKYISEYKITSKIQQLCEKDIDFPKHKALLATYSEQMSPVKFKNKITYSFDKNCVNIKQIENDFWVSEISNYSEKDAIETVKEKADCYDAAKRKAQYFRVGGPDKFYNVYTDKQIKGFK